MSSYMKELSFRKSTTCHSVDFKHHTFNVCILILKTRMSSGCYNKYAIIVVFIKLVTFKPKALPSDVSTTYLTPRSWLVISFLSLVYSGLKLWTIIYRRVSKSSACTLSYSLFGFLILFYKTMSNCSQNYWIDWNSASLYLKRLFHI